MKVSPLFGIKYCGGCNPYYDRTALAEKLRLQFPEIRLSSFRTQERYSVVIVLHGCSARCTNLEELINVPRLIHVDPTTSWAALEAQIREQFLD